MLITCAKYNLLNEEKMEKEKKTRRKGGEHEGSTHVGRETPGETALRHRIDFPKRKKIPRTRMLARAGTSNRSRRANARGIGFLLLTLCAGGSSNHTPHTRTAQHIHTHASKKNEGKRG
jgi:hypothetical protein